MNKINDDELQFVAKHYKQNCLNTNRAWKRFKRINGTQQHSSRRKIAVAASITLAPDTLFVVSFVVSFVL